MGTVSFPDPPARGGTYTASLDMSHEEANVLLDRLRAAINLIQNDRPAGTKSPAPMTQTADPQLTEPLPPHRFAAPGPPQSSNAQSWLGGAAITPSPQPSLFQGLSGLPGEPGGFLRQSFLQPPAVQKILQTPQQHHQQLQQQVAQTPASALAQQQQQQQPQQQQAVQNPPAYGNSQGSLTGQVVLPPPPPPRAVAPGTSAALVTPSQQWARAPMQVRAGDANSQEPNAMRAPVPQPMPQQAPKPVQPALAVPALDDIHALTVPQPKYLQGGNAQVDWRHCWTTEPEDHSGKPVTSLLYSPTFPGLAAGDDHAGWLVSSSRCLLNLWECNASGGRGGQPSLMLMHSQVTDFKTTDLAMDPGVSLLLATGMDISAGTDCVSLHTLSPDQGFLAYKSRLPVVGNHVGGGIMQRVVSLNMFGGPLSHCCAASLGSHVLVYNLPTTINGALPAKPKADWRAHSAPISALHRSNFSISLFTGATDGTVHMWDMKVKPNSPVRKWNLRHRVADMCAASEYQLVTAAEDGVLRVWDLRYNGPPVASATPDGSPLVAMAHSPVGAFCAVATARGLYTLDVGSSSSALGLLGCISPPGSSRAGPVSRLGWNTHTLELYATHENGRISVYASKQPL